MKDMTIGYKLKIAREQHNLTRVQLAEQIGSSSKTIARRERGETLPQPQFHRKLCSVLKITPQELGLKTKVATKNREFCRVQHDNPSTYSFDALSMNLTFRLSEIKGPPTLRKGAL